MDSLMIFPSNNIFTDDFIFCCLQDYWLSLLYKRLVGVKVLHVDGGTEEKRKIRVYAHCSSRYKINNDSKTGVLSNKELMWICHWLGSDWVY